MVTILHMIETSGPGGAENMMIRLIDNLDKEKFHSIVCLLKDGWLNKTLQRQGVETVIIPQTRSFDYTWIKSALKCLADKKIDLMHSHEFAMNTYSSMLSVIKGIPCVSTVHGKNYYWEKFQRKLAYRFVSRVSSMVPVSDDIRNFLVSKVGIHKKRLTVIPNGIDFNLYQNNEEKRFSFRKTLGISQDATLIGAVGNLYPVKGHTYLIQALAKIKQTHANIQLVIAGRGNELSSLQDDAKQYEVIDNVHFLGFREDIPEILNAIDMFVMPSLSEGMPLSILEAMAAERPVIASRVGGIPEVIVDSQTGYLSEAKSPVDLASKISKCIDDKDATSRIIKKAKEKVIMDFSMQAMMNGYLQMYDKLLKKKK